jgi:hypothetical protein
VGKTVEFGIWRASGTRWRDLSVKATGCRSGPTTPRIRPPVFSSYFFMCENETEPTEYVLTKFKHNNFLKDGSSVFLI